MPALLERPKMTRAMYEALKRHIMREREKKKQEQEQDAMMERLKKERELRKKKEEEDSLTLEQTNEQILQLEEKLEMLKKQKSELFSQLKKVLYQEDETRRRAQQKEQSELTISQPAYQHPPVLTTVPQPMITHGRPALYKPTVSTPIVTGMKRQRSPSPTPQSSSSSYQSYGHSEPKYSHTDSKYAHSEPKYQSHTEPKFAHADPKYLTSYAGAKAGQSGHLYTTQHAQPGDFKSSAYQPAGASHLYATNQSFQQQQTAAASAGPSYSSSQASSSKYTTPSQSAFTSYQSPFAQSHPQKALAEQFSAAYPIQRMQQPGYHTTMQIQQSLEHPGSKQPGFDDKYKLGQTQIRGMVASQQSTLMTQALQLQQQQAKNAGSFVPGYTSRSQPPPPGPNYPTSTSSSTYTNQTSGQGRPAYGSQSHGRYF
ncbi:hypothetical protein BsWGS_08183 [Bradybaena similaris]